MVASHTEKPLGFSNQRSLFAKRGKVNGWYGIAPNNIACLYGRRHVLRMSLTYGKVLGVVSLCPAISQPLWGQLYGWLPLSDAYGIFIANGLTASSLQTAPA